MSFTEFVLPLPELDFETTGDSIVRYCCSFALRALSCTRHDMGGRSFMVKSENTGKSTHLPLWQTCTVLHPWVLFSETMVYTKLQVANNKQKCQFCCVFFFGAPNLWASSTAFTMTSSKFTLICSSHEPFKLYINCLLVLLWSLESLHSFLVQDFWVLRLAAQSCTAVKPGIVILCNFYPTIGTCGQRVCLLLESLQNTLEQTGF